MFERFRGRPPGPEQEPSQKPRETIKYMEEPLEQISPQEVKGNLPELSAEQLEVAKQAFVESMRNGDILVQAKLHRFFSSDKAKEDTRQLTQQDLEGTGLNYQDLGAEMRGEQTMKFAKFTNGYRKFAKIFGSPFLKGLLTGFNMRGDRIPTRDVSFIVEDSDYPKVVGSPGYWGNTLLKQDEERAGKRDKKRDSRFFQTRVGDVRFDYLIEGSGQEKQGKSMPVKFAQVYISGLAVGYDKRNAECVLTAFLSPSNSETHGNPSLKLKPETQDPASLAMLRRALKTDPQFLLNVFHEFVPEAFEAAHLDDPYETNYYPPKGKYPMHILFDTPGLKLVDFETDFEVGKK